MPLSIAVESIEELRQRKLVEIYNKYSAVSSGVDPDTGKPIYVDCVVGSTTYRMNAGKLAANTMRDGIDLIELQGLTVMPKVRDFNNVDHANMALADAKSINISQGLDAYVYWMQKSGFVDTVTAATTASVLLAINVSFNVSVV